MRLFSRTFGCLLIIVLFAIACEQKTTKGTATILEEDTAGASAATTNRSSDSSLIMKAIEMETRNFYKKDHAAWSESYIQSPTVYWACVEEGVTLRAKGWNDLSQFVATWMKENPAPMDYEKSKFTNTSVKMEIAPNMAFVNIEGNNVMEDGKTIRYTVGSRTMVKENGTWKILAMTSYPADNSAGSTPNIYVHHNK